jgi:hypothetical protein
MAGNGADVLREFVVSLGWKVDEPQFKAMIKNVTAVATAVTEISAAVTAAAYVVDKYVTQMAQKMEKLYFQAERSGASVKSLEALEFGAQQIGMAAGAATSLIEGMTSAMRSNPGLAQMLGITPGKDPTKNFINIIDSLKKMGAPGSQGYAIAAQIAAQFGMSEPDLLMYEKSNDELKASIALREKMFADAGMNPDAAAQESHMFDNRMRTLQASIEIVQVLMAEQFMPAINTLVDGIGWVVGKITKADKGTGGVSTGILGIVAGLLAIGGGSAILKVLLSMFGVKNGGLTTGLLGWLVGVGTDMTVGAMAISAGLVAIVVALTAVAFNVGNWADKISSALHLDHIISKLGLGPKGKVLVDGKWQDAAGVGLDQIAPAVMNQESGGHQFKNGHVLASTAGALGLMGLMPGTAAMLGVNPMDAVQNMAGGRAYLGQLYAKYKDWPDALAAYNWGPGHVDHALAKHQAFPDSVQAYQSSVMNAAIARGGGGRHFTANTTVTVNGSTDPALTASKTGKEVNRVLADAQRNFVPRTN